MGMLNRRDAMLRLGQFGLGGMTLPALLRAEISPARHRATADRCIFVFLWGGPPQHDLWDPKPDAPAGIRSEFGVTATNVPGIRIADSMPLLAQRMDRVAIVRSLSHDSNNHEPSVYRMLTGQKDPTLVVPRNQRTRKSAPFFGSALSYFTPPTDVPACVTLPRPIGHSGVTYAGTHAGFLGPRHDPFERAAAGDTRETPAHPVQLDTDLAETRLIAREGLRKLLEDQDRLLQADRAGRDLDEFRARALRMVASPAVRRAFDLDTVPLTLRERYGRNDYGESFLLARRLVEAGVKVVSIAWMYIFPEGRVSNIWDNHAGYGIHGAKTGYDLLRSPVGCPPLDRGLTALLDDLSITGQLDRTLIVVAGEFGRTPKINKDAGRDHWGACQSILFAGGGIRGGQVYGSSDPQGAYPSEQPVAPEDILATIYHAMGVNPDAELLDRENRPHRLCDGQPLTGLFG
jgi:hypothetical protein